MNKSKEQYILELESKIEILERENEILSTKAEDNLLLYKAFEDINDFSRIEDVLLHTLESISILVNIDFSGIFQLQNSKFICTNSYALFSTTDTTNCSISISNKYVKKLAQNGYCYISKDSKNFTFQYPTTHFSPHTTVLIAVDSSVIENHYFVFVNDSKNQDLLPKIDLLRKISSIIASKLERLYYQNQLEEINTNLESIVAERTTKIIEQKNEYASLYEEYKSTNEELLLSNIKIEESELKYKEIFNSTSDAIFIHDFNFFEIIDVNNTMLTIYGYTREEICAIHISDLSATSQGYTSEKAQEKIDQTIEHGITNFEWLAKKKNGDVFWVSVILKTIKINTNNRIMAIVRDIHSQKIAEEAIRLSEEKFQKAFMLSPDAFVLSDLRTSHYIDVNDSFLRLMEYTRYEIIGKSAIALHIWNNPQERLDFTALLQKNLKVLDFEAEFRTKTNKTGLVSISAELITIHNTVCIIAQMRDITERKRIENENNYQRQVLNTLLENLPIGVFMVEAPSGKPLIANHKAKELLGRGILPDASEKNLAEVYQAYITNTRTAYPIHNMPIIQGLYGLKSHIDNMTVVRPDGTETQIEIFGTPVFDNSNTIIASIVSFFDISERKKNEYELQKKTNELEHFFSTSLDLLCIANTQGNFLRVNKEWEKILGYKTHELENRSFFDFVHPDDIERTKTAMGKITKKEQILNFTNRYKTKDSTYRWIEWRSTPSNEGLIYAAARDITNRIRTEQELIQAKEKAEESDRLKTAFLQNMSHEIRTPLNAIMGFSDLLPDAFDDKETLYKFTTIIKQRSADLLEIINDILDIAKIESGQISLNIEECNLKHLFGDIEVFFKEYRTRIQKDSVEFIVQIDADVIQSTIKIDKIKLKQIIINLISNAFKFTESGKIVLGCKFGEGNVLLVYVQDTGIGISKQNQSKVFERFVQASTDTTGVYSGTGLGLSITKGLLELVGGTITLASAPNKGSTFTFTYPFEKQTIQNKNKSLPPLLKHETTHAHIAILIIEDDIYNAEYLRAALSKLHAQIFIATNAKQGIQIALKNTIDIILMDIRLPDMTGYEATEIIRAAKPYQKIIAQTSYAAPDERIKALHFGFTDYISKPIQRNDLLTLLETHIANNN